MNSCDRRIHCYSSVHLFIIVLILSPCFLTTGEKSVSATTASSARKRVQGLVNKFWNYLPPLPGFVQQQKTVQTPVKAPTTSTPASREPPPEGRAPADGNGHQIPVQNRRVNFSPLLGNFANRGQKARASTPQPGEDIQRISTSEGTRRNESALSSSLTPELNVTPRSSAVTQGDEQPEEGDRRDPPSPQPEPENSPVQVLEDQVETESAGILRSSTLDIATSTEGPSRRSGSVEPSGVQSSSEASSKLVTTSSGYAADSEENGPQKSSKMPESKKIDFEKSADELEKDPRKSISSRAMNPQNSQETVQNDQDESLEESASKEISQHGVNSGSSSPVQTGKTSPSQKTGYNNYFTGSVQQLKNATHHALQRATGAIFQHNPFSGRTPKSPVRKPEPQPSQQTDGIRGKPADSSGNTQPNEDELPLIAAVRQSTCLSACASDMAAAKVCDFYLVLHDALTSGASAVSGSVKSMAVGLSAKDENGDYERISKPKIDCKV